MLRREKGAGRRGRDDSETIRHGYNYTRVEKFVEEELKDLEEALIKRRIIRLCFLSSLRTS